MTEVIPPIPTGPSPHAEAVAEAFLLVEKSRGLLAMSVGVEPDNHYLGRLLLREGLSNLEKAVVRLNAFLTTPQAGPGAN